MGIEEVKEEVRGQDTKCFISGYVCDAQMMEGREKMLAHVVLNIVRYMK